MGIGIGNSPVGMLVALSGDHSPQATPRSRSCERGCGGPAMAPPAFSPSSLQRLHPPPASAAALRSLLPSPNFGAPPCTSSLCFTCEAAPGEGLGLGFRILSARGVHSAGAVSSSSLSASATASAKCCGGGGAEGLSLRCAGRGGFGFRVWGARGVVTGCVSRMDSSLGVDLDEDRVAAAGVVVPAREEIYSEAVRALRSGHVVAVPTDTLYGLACDASSGEAIRRVYEIKERNLSSPLAVCVADVDLVGAYGDTTHLPAGLLSALLPGAVTLVLPRRESGLLSAALNPEVGSIGIRIPDSDFIRGLSRSFGGALALTSANSSGHASTVRVDEFEHLWPHCAFVFDAGTLPGGRAGSTIVDLTQEGLFKMVRPGSMLQKTEETLAKFGLRDSSS